MSSGALRYSLTSDESTSASYLKFILVYLLSKYACLSANSANNKLKGKSNFFHNFLFFFSFFYFRKVDGSPSGWCINGWL